MNNSNSRSRSQLFHLVALPNIAKKDFDMDFSLCHSNCYLYSC